MCLLVEELGVVYKSQNVYEDAIVGLLVEISFFSAMTLINHNVYSLEKILHKVMFADGITWLSVFHERDEAEVQEAFYVSINNTIFRSLSLSIANIECFLNAKLNHGFEEFLHGFGVLVQSLVLEVSEEAVYLLFLSLLVTAFFQVNSGPLIEIIS